MKSSPVKGGVRRRRNRAPILSGSGDASVVKYSVLGPTFQTVGGTGCSAANRMYIPGFPGELVNFSGPNIVSFYSTGKFMPGTRIRWEPSVSFSTSGRVIVGFTDNPEIISTIMTAYNAFVVNQTAGTYQTYANMVRGLGSVQTFPVWQETDIPFPTKLRRKRFDINAVVNTTDSNVLDRSLQTCMFVALEGAPAEDLAMGGFHYHDVVDVEGITGVTT